MPNYMTCIHQDFGLCPECQAEWEADPSAWIEYGNHPMGIANWQRTLEEIRQDAEAKPMKVEGQYVCPF